ncbi:MAG TPA: hypothetical protein VHB20_01090 [Verrucomicrobiae bacterium]|jgi:hypothetical protein|nr:hypothetical protein [Verrucomicrobiae bacterium]
MAEGPIAAEAQEFIVRFITSVERLEILCLLVENPAREWAPGEVFRVIQSTEKTVQESLRQFLKDGLCAEPAPGRFQFAPASEKLAKAAAAVVRAYRERSVAVIESIYKRPSGPAQSFADAFRLRKEK